MNISCQPTRWQVFERARIFHSYDFLVLLMSYQSVALVCSLHSVYAGLKTSISIDFLMNLTYNALYHY